MANLVFDASKQVEFALLTDFGFALGPVYVAETVTGARKAWRAFNDVSGFSVTTVFDTAHTVPLNQEILIANNWTANEIAEASICLKASARATRNAALSTYDFGIKVTAAGAITMATPSLNLTYTKSVAPTGLDGDTAIAMRTRMDTAGTKLYCKIWGSAVDGLEAAEPAAWNYEADFTGDANEAASAYLAIGEQYHALKNRNSIISIATEGDTALFSLPEQTVATPTALSATPTDTTATLTWT